MEVAKVILDYLRLFVPYVTIGVLLLIFIFNFKENIAGLIDRITKYKGLGQEFEASQRAQELKGSNIKKEDLPIEDNVSSPAKELSPEDMAKRLESEKQNTLFWEFRYLDYYLVERTKQVLRWFSTLENKCKLSKFETEWGCIIQNTSERSVILDVLKKHQLIVEFIVEDSNLCMEITKKGKCYVQRLPDLGFTLLKETLMRVNERAYQKTRMT